VGNTVSTNSAIALIGLPFLFRTHPKSERRFNPHVFVVSISRQNVVTITADE
jgi:hypothetical protein